MPAGDARRLAGRALRRHRLPTPYQASLHYREAVHFKLASQSGATRPVQCGNMVLMERPRAYVHLPTASLQLVYDMRMELPKEVRQLSLYHVDERPEADKLVARLNRNRPDLYLVPLHRGQPQEQLLQLRDGYPAPSIHGGCGYRRVLHHRRAGWCATSGTLEGLVGSPASRRGALSSPIARHRCRGSAGADLLDDGGRRAVLHQPQHLHHTAVGLDQIGTDDLIDAIVASLTSTSGRTGQQVFRRILGKAHHPIHRFQTGQHRHASIHRVDRPARAFEAAHRAIIVHRHHQPVARARACSR